jgi:hypothetical protein
VEGGVEMGALGWEDKTENVRARNENAKNSL